MLPLGTDCVGALLATPACAPKQRVPLDVSPITTAVFLDGEELEGMPQELRLRSDRPHTLMFKSEGHRTQMLLLRSVSIAGKPRLEPAAVKLRLIPLDATRRDLVIEPLSEAPPRVLPASPGPAEATDPADPPAPSGSSGGVPDE